MSDSDSPLTDLRVDHLPRTVDASDDMLILTIILSVMIGILLTILAWYGRQRWLMFWSVGLILASVAYAVSFSFGVR